MKYFISALELTVFLAGFSLAAAATEVKSSPDNNINASTCSGGLSVDDKIQTRVDAAKIDYRLDPDGFRERLVKESIELFQGTDLDKIGYFVYTILPDNPSRITDSVETVTIGSPQSQTALNGAAYMMYDVALNKKYGDYFFNTKARFPKIVDLIRQVKSGFKPEDMGTAFPNKIVTLSGERTILILGGCTPHDCGGTENLVAFDYQNERAYVLQENSNSTKVYIYGNPDKEIRNILLYEYLY